MILGLGQEMYEMAPEASCARKDRGAQTAHSDVKGTQEPTERAASGQSWNNLSNKIK